MSFAAQFPALPLTKHQNSPHVVPLLQQSLPKPCSQQTHLVSDLQPQTNQIGIIHNVPVGQGGSFGASCCPLEDTGHLCNTTSSSEDELKGDSPGNLKEDSSDSGVIFHFFLPSDLGDCFLLL